MIHNIKHTKCYLFFIIFLHPFFASSQVEYTETHYDLSDFVPENQARSIQKDAYGFYWIVTPNGLVLRWNGNNFILVKDYIKKKSTTPVPVFFYGIKDYSGRLIFPQINSRITYTPNERGLLEPLDTNIIRKDAFFSKVGNFVYLKKQWSEIEKLNNKDLTSSLKEAINDGDREYRYGYSIGEEEFYLVNKRNIIYYLNGKINILSTAETKMQKIVFLVGKHLICIWDGSYEIYLNGKCIKKGVNHLISSVNNFINLNIYQGANAGYILTTNVIYKVTVKEDDISIRKYLDLPGNPISANSFYIDEVAERIFIILLTGGLSVYERKFFFNESKSTISRANVMYTLLSVNNRIYTNQAFQEKINDDSYDYNMVAPAAVLPNGDFFYPSAYSGVTLFDKNLRIKKRWKVDNVFATKSLVTINNVLWTTINQKLMRYDYKLSKLDEVTLNPVLKKTEQVKFIAKGTPGFVFAVIDTIVYKMDINNGNRKQVGNLKSFGGEIRDLKYSEEHNGLFLSVRNNGFYFLDLSTGVLRAFPILDFPQLLSCHYVLKDNGGDYWLPTNNGLYFLFKKQMDDFLSGRTSMVNYYRFGKERGIENLEFNGGFSNSGICVGDSVFLSSMSGIVRFSASEVKKMLGATYKGKIFILGINEDDSAKVFSPRVSLRPGFKRFVIKYDFPFINVPDAVLEYQLLGTGDSTWLLLPKSNELLLRTLKAGTYTLKVRVQNNPDIATSVITIVVKQYWYLSNLAYSIYAVLLFLLLFIFYNWRVNVLKSRSLLEVDKSRRQLFAIVSHDLRSPLKTYQGMADVISYLLKRGEYNRIEQIAAQIDDTGAKFELLLKNLLNWNLLEQQKLIVSKTTLDVVKLIDDLLPLYKGIGSNKDVSIAFHCTNRDKLVATDEGFFSLIVRNLLDNAVKNAPGGSMIDLYLDVVVEGLVMRLENSITLEQQQKLKEVSVLFNSNATWEPGTQGMGMGLKMIKLAVKKLGGTASVSIINSRVEWKVVL